MELHKYWGVGGRRCGGCEAAPAAVHCRSCPATAGGAFLCAACDARPGHARLGHERVWMCEVCELAPAAVTCKADAAVLCAACDADIHDANPLARRHERVPVQPIGAAAPAADPLLFGFGAAAAEEKDDAAAAAGMLAGGAIGGGANSKVDGKLDFLFADVMGPFLGQDFARFPLADSVVPNHGSCGGALDIDFGGAAAAAVAAKPSYSSYTAASLGNSVST